VVPPWALVHRLLDPTQVPEFPVARYSQVAEFTGAGVLTAVTSAKVPAVAAFGGTGVLSAVAFARVELPGPFAGVGTLSAVARVAAPANFSGSGVLSALARAAVVAPFEGEGVLTAEALQRSEAVAAFTGAGVLSAVAFARVELVAAFAGSGAITAEVEAIGGTYEADAEFAGSGTLSAVGFARYVRDAEFTGAGALSAEGAGFYVRAAEFVGAGVVSAVAIQQFVRTAAFTGAGVLSAVAIPATVPMGVDKSGTQSLAGAVWTKVVSWTVKSGYPDTVIDTDSLALRPGTYDLDGQFTHDNPRISRVRLMKNASEVAMLDSVVNVSTLRVLAGRIDFTTGDVLSLEAYTTASRTILAAGTYLTATPTPGGAVAMGIFKDYSAQSVVSNAAAVVTSGVSVKPGYPSTKVSGNTMVARAGTYNLVGRVQYGSTSDPTVKIFKNGSEIASNTGGNGYFTTVSPTNVVLADGDVLELRIASSQGETVVGGPDATYLTATPV
jgi:hypothetical protein